MFVLPKFDTLSTYVPGGTCDMMAWVAGASFEQFEMLP